MVLRSFRGLDVVVQCLALQLLRTRVPCGRAALVGGRNCPPGRADCSAVCGDACVTVGCTAMRRTGCASPSFPFVLFIILRILFSYWLLAPSPQLQRASRPRSGQL